MDRDTSDDTDGALATNEELLEVVAGVVLAELGEIIDDGTVRKDGLEAEDSTVERSVAEETKTSCVGGDIAADVA